MFVGPDDESNAVAHTKLKQHVRNVSFHSGAPELKVYGDLGVRALRPGLAVNPRTAEILEQLGPRTTS